MKPIIIVVLLLLGWITILTIFAAQRAREKEIEEEVETLSQTMGWDISRIVKWLRKNHGVDVED